MNRLALSLLATAGLSLAQPDALAKEIYTWTDQNGVVHYVDTPPDNPDARSIEAPEAYRPGSVSLEPVAPDVPEVDAMEGEATDDALSPADAKRQELAEERARRRAQQAERDAICNEAQRRLAIVEPTRRVFYEDEQGETVRLDDEERVRLVEDYKRQIEEYCR
jgi:hypothetical protein